MREETRVLDLEEAVKTLPDKAPIQDEIDWIRSHPAMVRKARLKDAEENVLIDSNDILRPPHGRAPSKSAVYALQHWCNVPNKFFEMILSEHKKITEDSAQAKAAAKDTGIDEIESMLASVQIEAN